MDLNRVTIVSDAVAVWSVPVVVWSRSMDKLLLPQPGWDGTSVRYLFPLTRIHIDVHTDIDVNLYIRIHIDVHTDIDVNLYIRIHIDVHTDIDVNLYIRIHIDVHTDIDVNLYIRSSHWHWC